MDTLLSLLKFLETDNSVTPQEFLSNEHPIVKAIEHVAEGVLIVDGTEWEVAMDVLKEKGYRVFPVERDRFGWLIGGISTKKGVVTYG